MRVRLYILLRMYVRVCVCVRACVRMFCEVPSGEPDVMRETRACQKIEITTTILRVSTIIIDLSL